MIYAEILLNCCLFQLYPSPTFLKLCPQHAKIIKFQGDIQHLRSDLLNYSCQRLEKKDCREISPYV